MIVRKHRYICESEIIFKIAFTIFYITVILSSTIMFYTLGAGFQTSLKVIRYISYLICIFKFINDRFYFKDTYKVILIFLFSALVTYTSSSMLILTYAFIFVAVYGIQEKEVLQCALVVQSVMFVLTIIMCKMGLNIDYVWNEEIRIRHGLGFIWASYAPILFFFIILLYISLRKNKLKMVEILIFEMINGILYVLTDTRLAFYLLTVALVYFWGMIHFRWISKLLGKIKGLIIASPFLIAIVTVYLHLCYSASSPVWVKLNSVLSNRLKLGKEAIERYGVRLLGREIEWIGNGYGGRRGTYNYVDSGYIRILLDYGLIFLILCLFIYAFILYNALNEKNYYLVSSILIVLIICITEPHLINLLNNPFPLLAVSNIKKSLYLENKKLGLRGYANDRT